MAVAIIMPRQGQSVESCVITEWKVKVGDKVAEGDILFSYETDKSSFDEPAQAAGTVLAVFWQDGDDVPCLEPVCAIGEDGDWFAKPGAEAAAPATPATSSGGIRTYKVQAGDTPGKIARKIYGRSSLYTVIMRANPNVNERKLRPGMILNIPAINTDKK